MSTKVKKKLLLVGATKGSTHVRNYYFLVKDYFDEVLIVTNEKIDFCDFRIAEFSLKNPLSYLMDIKAMKKTIRDFKPSVIHSHQANAVSFMAARANKKARPLVVTAWGSDVLLLPNRGVLAKFMVTYCLKKADIVTADAKFVGEAVSKLAPKSRVVLANFGIDFNEGELGVKENIIYSNRLHKDIYNIDQIIEGFSVFQKDHPNWRLVVGANGPLTVELKKLASELLEKDSYEFIGFVSSEENRANYLKAKIWISVPSSDGTAISLLEAMAYGCCPVVSNLPANREWVSHSENGVIVNDSVHSALEIATKLDNKGVIDRNLDLIRKKGTKKANKAIFEEMYEELVSEF